MWNRIIRQIIVHVVNMSVVYHRTGLPHCSELLPFTLSGISRPPSFFTASRLGKLIMSTLTPCGSVIVQCVFQIVEWVPTRIPI